MVGLFYRDPEGPPSHCRWNTSPGGQLSGGIPLAKLPGMDGQSMIKKPPLALYRATLGNSWGRDLAGPSFPRRSE